MRFFYFLFFIFISLSSFSQSTINIVLSSDYTDVCLGEEVVFTISESKENTKYYLYENRQAKLLEIIGNGGAMQFNSLKVDSGIYFIVILLNNVIIKISNDILITVHKPTEKNFMLTTSTHLVCEGNDVNISMPAFSSDVTYSLYSNDVLVGDGVVSSSNILNFPVHKPIVTSLYTVKAKGMYCTSSENIYSDISVEVFQRPSLDLNVMADVSQICKNESFIISVGNTTDNVYYKIYNGKEFIEPPLVGNGAEISFSPLYLTQSSDIKLVTYSSMCPDKLFLKQKIHVDVIDYGELPIDYILSPEKVCQGEVFSLSIPESMRGKLYRLENLGIEIARTEGTGGIITLENLHYRNNSNFELLLDVCSERTILANPIVTQVDIPVIEYDISDILYRDDGEIRIQINGGTPPYRYNLHPLNSTITTLNDEYVFKNLEKGFYSISVSDANNCSDIQNLNLEIKSEAGENIVLNNVLTPNGDGFNDFFRIEYNDDLGRIKLLIFNIYGQSVFTSPDYHSTWDGDQLPDGSYYYMIKFIDSNIASKKGIITILSK